MEKIKLEEQGIHVHSAMLPVINVEEKGITQQVVISNNADVPKV